MSARKVQSLLPVTLLGGGDVSAALVNEALQIAPFLIAADGGANMAISAGMFPEVVIGDMDSIHPDVIARLAADRIWRIEEQETTDFEKCLSRVEAPFIIGVGFTGVRLDHTLAVWTALARYPDRRCLILGAQDLAFLAPRHLVLMLSAGTRVSLFPLGPVRGQSRGLVWPIGGLAFAPDSRIGTSNQATGMVTLDFDAAKMLVILPRNCLGAAIAALVSADRG